MVRYVIIAVFMIASALAIAQPRAKWKYFEKATAQGQVAVAGPDSLGQWVSLNIATLADTSSINWPYEGLLIHVDDVDKYWKYNGTTWEEFELGDAGDGQGVNAAGWGLDLISSPPDTSLAVDTALVATLVALGDTASQLRADFPDLSAENVAYGTGSAGEIAEWINDSTLTFDATGANQLSTGTTAQRPIISEGQIRYGTDNERVEVSTNTDWLMLPYTTDILVGDNQIAYGRSNGIGVEGSSNITYDHPHYFANAQQELRVNDITFNSIGAIDGLDAGGTREALYNNGYVFTTDRNGDEILVIDVSDPTSPSLVETYSHSSFDKPNKFEIIDSLDLLIACFDNDLFATIDISDPTNLVLSDTINDSSIPVGFSNPGAATAKWLNDTLFAFVAHGDGVSVLDITDPATIEHIHTDTMSNAVSYPLWNTSPNGIIFYGDDVIFMSATNRGVVAIDASNIRNMSIAWYEGAGSFNDSREIQTYVNPHDGTPYLFSFCEGSNIRFKWWDISDPLTETEAGSQFTGFADNIWDALIIGYDLFIPADVDDLIRYFDFHDFPSSPNSNKTIAQNNGSSIFLDKVNAITTNGYYIYSAAQNGFHVWEKKNGRALDIDERGIKLYNRYFFNPSGPTAGKNVHVWNNGFGSFEPYPPLPETLNFIGLEIDETVDGDETLIVYDPNSAEGLERLNIGTTIEKGKQWGGTLYNSIIDTISIQFSVMAHTMIFSAEVNSGGSSDMVIRLPETENALLGKTIEIANVWDASGTYDVVVESHNGSTAEILDSGSAVSSVTLTANKSYNITMAIKPSDNTEYWVITEK